MSTRRQIVQGMGIKTLLDATALEAQQHDGVFAVLYDRGEFFVVFGEQVRKIRPKGVEGHNRLRPALIQALAPDEDKDDALIGF